MAQDLTVNIKTTSDVPAAMDKAKKATDSFAKQTEDIQKKFSGAFKDIFLGFVAPMILVQKALGFITDAIAEANRLAKEGVDIIAKGETKMATSEEAKMAQFLKAKDASEQEAKAVKAGRREMTEKYLTETPEGKAILQAEREKRSDEDFVNPKILADIEKFQNMALDAFLKSEEGKKFQPIFEDNKSTPFKGPEGFGNVIGVGANPVMEAMNAQLEEQQKQTALLEKIANPAAGLGPDFTKDPGFVAYGEQM
jgi:hypothetical protein